MQNTGLMRQGSWDGSGIWSLSFLRGLPAHTYDLCEDQAQRVLWGGVAAQLPSLEGRCCFTASCISACQLGPGDSGGGGSECATSRDPAVSRTAPSRVCVWEEVCVSMVHTEIRQRPSGR